MTSDELNRRIRELCDEPEKCGGFEAFGGKSIPYIGWYWRTVNFDIGSEYLQYFGVLPGGEIGFMQNNKWEYPEVFVDTEQWEKIKELLIAAVLEPTREKFGAVYATVQEVGHRR